MKENIFEEIKKLKGEIAEQTSEYEKNNELLNEMCKNPLVMEAIKLQLYNEKLSRNVNKIKNDVELLIEENCTHNLLLYRGYSYSYPRWYYDYRCIECGKKIESFFELKNVIDIDVPYQDLKRDFNNYLFKYDEETAIQIMLAKYSNQLFNDLVNSGVDEIKALTLLRKNK